MGSAAMKVKYFKSPAEFRRWLEKNHATTQELWVGYYKKSSAKPSITWPESVDEALCFGWIDGIRKSVDDLRYTSRFTPRRRGSIWSAVNIKRAQELRDKGLMHPAGMAAFNARKKKVGHLFLRTKERQSRWALREKAAPKQSRMGFLLCSAALVSKSNRVVDHKCKAGGDATKAIAKANRRIGEQKTPALVTEKLTFLNCEADITPAAPFVMRCPLSIAASGFLIVCVSLRDEFRKCSIHLHVVRHQQSAVAQPGPKLVKLPEHMPVTMRAVVQKHIDG